MIDDRIGICFAQNNPCPMKFKRRSLPGAMYPFVGHSGKLRNPLPNVIALRIEFLALGDRIKDTKVWSSIGTATTYSLPSHSIIGQVGINQCIPKPDYRTSISTLAMREALNTVSLVDHSFQHLIFNLVMKVTRLI